MRRFVAVFCGLILLLVLGDRGTAAEAEIVLRAADAGISGGAEYYADGDFIGAWNDPNATIQWDLTLDEPATPRVDLNYSCQPGCGGKFQLEIGPKKLLGETRTTASWYDYKTMDLGRVSLPKGKYLVTLRAGSFQVAPMNVKTIRLVAAKGSAKAHDTPPLGVPLPPVYVVPNFHPASCGWLTNWSVERNYCANSYLNHLDRVRDDANYEFVLSECNNMIAIHDFQPARFEELRRRIKDGRVELVNAFFLEPTINLSGGEALAEMGIEGLRWQEQVLGTRPRFCWAIDTCGVHAQMPQLCAKLGLEALIYTRCSRSGKAVFWSESPDGSRVLTIVPGGYSEDWGRAFSKSGPVSRAQMASAEREIAAKVAYFPAGTPVLILGGAGDYALAPASADNPSSFLKRWKSFRPDVEVRFSTLTKYFDALLTSLKASKAELPTVVGGSSYTFDSFWIECPRVKSWYRRDEHALQAAESLATIASLERGWVYPVQDFYHAWLQMLLNMDRNTLWGAAGGMVFEHATSWDARDRFQWVEQHSCAALEEATRKLLGAGKAVGLFNPTNWKRNDPLLLRLPAGTRLAGTACQSIENGTTLCNVEMPSMGVVGMTLESAPPATPQEIALPTAIETAYYSARIDAATGALVSLKIKPSGREMLGGPANVLVAEAHRGDGDPGDFTNARPGRPRLGSSSDSKPTIRTTKGPLAITVTAEGKFYGGGLARRVMRFYRTHPRIDFETELNNLPNLTVVVAEFPLAQSPTEFRRGIPFGFAHSAWARPNPALQDPANGIQPAVRWSDYVLPSGDGVAILDRGLSGREINDKTPILYLYNATEKYYGYANAWLAGKGSHRSEYAMLAHEGDWKSAGIARMAWEYNSPVTLADGCAVATARSFLETSDNVVVEVMRREGADIEVRLVECLGLGGEAWVKLALPYEQATMTDLLGRNPKPLGNGPDCKFSVRPQEIVTLRFRTSTPVPAISPLLDWEPLVPPNKRAALRQYLKNVVGHPPLGN